MDEFYYMEYNIRKERHLKFKIFKYVRKEIQSDWLSDKTEDKIQVNFIRFPFIKNDTNIENNIKDNHHYNHFINEFIFLCGEINNNICYLVIFLGSHVIYKITWWYVS